MIRIRALRRSRYFIAVIFNLGSVAAFSQDGADIPAISGIKEEGLNHSKVMEYAFYLTDVNGPRLSNSPGLRKAQEWAVRSLKSWGLENVHLESWGTFGKGWEVEKAYAATTLPYYHPVIAVPKAWTGSTNGLIRSDIVLIKADTMLIKQLGAKLNGKIVIYDTDEIPGVSFKPDGSRFTEEELAGLDSLPPLKKASSALTARLKAFRQRLDDLLYEQKVALVLSKARGSHGTVFTTNGASYAADAKPVTAGLEVSAEDHLRILRLIKAGYKVEMEAEIRTKFYDSDPKGYNVIAEIPGTDPKLKNEVVMLGAHLDSWHAATGATDNAAGCSVMMEAIRILKSLDLKPRRTIRLALWSSEEQGLWGSKGYVAGHFGDVNTMKLKPEQKTISAYFNLDNGTGKIRGVYLQQNALVKPVFEQWLKPFHDLGASTLAMRNAGGTDHLSFDALGIPGFQFIQDRIEYFTRTHHTNQDTYDRLVPDDLKQAATIVAAFVYQTAQREQKLPRKELPGIN